MLDVCTTTGSGDKKTMAIHAPHKNGLFYFLASSSSSPYTLTQQAAIVVSSCRRHRGCARPWPLPVAAPHRPYAPHDTALHGLRATASWEMPHCHAPQLAHGSYPAADRARPHATTLHVLLRGRCECCPTTNVFRQTIGRGEEDEEVSCGP
jgi:hypothetical protein